MTLPSSGTITMDMVATELGIPNTGLSLNDSRVRALAGIPSGTIGFYNLYGKSSYIPMSLYAPDAYDFTDSRWGPGVATAYPEVLVTNGLAPFTYQWTLNSSSFGVTLDNPNSPRCTVKRSYVQNSQGRATAVLSCVVTDATGRTASVSNVTAIIEWEGDR